MASRIQIQRLKVLTRTGQTAYDECFHKGINIIRGENSSGKSTITYDIIDTILLSLLSDRNKSKQI